MFFSIFVLFMPDKTLAYIFIDMYINIWFWLEHWTHAIEKNHFQLRDYSGTHPILQFKWPLFCFYLIRISDICGNSHAFTNAFESIDVLYSKSVQNWLFRWLYSKCMDKHLDFLLFFWNRKKNWIISSALKLTCAPKHKSKLLFCCHLWHEINFNGL